MSGRLKAFARRLLRELLWWLSIPLILIVLAVVFFGDMSNACWEDSEAVAKARGLSAARLSVLYRDMKIYATERDPPMFGYSRFPAQPQDAIPAAFADLQAAKVDPQTGHIMLQGCIDAGVDLYFEGLTDSTEPARIVLRWGDHHESGEQVLWEE